MRGHRHDDRFAFAVLAQEVDAELEVRAAREDQARREAAIAAAGEQFKTSHPDLTDKDLHYLAEKAASLQVMGGLVRQHNGDISAAYQEALDGGTPPAEIELGTATRSGLWSPGHMRIEP